MSERKVLNKYYPPDFDPSKIPRAKCSKNRQFTVRLMAPCNMKCYTCGEYIAKGKKFNARKEDVEDQTYLGIRIYRFYIKCPGCISEISFRTDPETTDYIIEAGAHRNFQALKLAEEQAAREAQEVQDEIDSNPMLLLENRTQQSQYEMDLVESLEDLRELNERQASIDLGKVVSKYQKEKQLTAEQIEENERMEALVAMGYEMIEGKLVKRLREEEQTDDDTFTKKTKIENNWIGSDHLTDGKSKTVSLKSKLTGLVKKKSVQSVPTVTSAPPTAAPAPTAPAPNGCSSSERADQKRMPPPPPPGRRSVGASASSLSSRLCAPVLNGTATTPSPPPIATTSSTATTSPSQIATTSPPSPIATTSSPSPIATTSSLSPIATTSSLSPIATTSSPSPIATTSSSSPIATTSSPANSTPSSTPVAATDVAPAACPAPSSLSLLGAYSDSSSGSDED